jgi:hypothetical protein
LDYAEWGKKFIGRTFIHGGKNKWTIFGIENESFCIKGEGMVHGHDLIRSVYIAHQRKLTSSWIFLNNKFDEHKKRLHEPA